MAMGSQSELITGDNPISVIICSRMTWEVDKKLFLLLDDMESVPWLVCFLNLQIKAEVEDFCRSHMFLRCADYFCKINHPDYDL